MKGSGSGKFRGVSVSNLNNLKGLVASGLGLGLRVLQPAKNRRMLNMHGVAL